MRYSLAVRVRPPRLAAPVRDRRHVTGACIGSLAGAGPTKLNGPLLLLLLLLAGPKTETLHVASSAVCGREGIGRKAPCG